MKEARSGEPLGQTSGPAAPLLKAAATLEAAGLVEEASALRGQAERVRRLLATWWEAPLSIQEAAHFGGYSEAQLRRLMSAGTVPTVGARQIPRRYVPVRPGHLLPLGLPPLAVASPDWAADLVQNRRLGAGR